MDIMETVSNIQCSACGRAGDDVAPARPRGNLPYCPRCVKKCSLCHVDADTLGYLSDGKLRLYVCVECWNKDVQEHPRWLEHSRPPGRCELCDGPDPVAEFEFDDGSIGLYCNNCGNPNAKRRRGRPAVFKQMRFRKAGLEHPSTSTLGLLVGCGVRTTVTVSNRTAVNRRYAETVMDLFRPFDNNHDLKRVPCDENLSWLLSDEALANGRRLTIPIELGRLLSEVGPERTRRCAESICKAKPKTHTAVAVIRGLRMTGRTVNHPGGEKTAADTGSTRSLVMILSGAIDRYLTRYPGTTEDEIIRALYVVADTVAENPSTGDANAAE